MVVVWLVGLLQQSQGWMQNRARQSGTARSPAFWGMNLSDKWLCLK